MTNLQRAAAVLLANAGTQPDASMDGATDVGTVPLDDLAALRSALDSEPALSLELDAVVEQAAARATGRPVLALAPTPPKVLSIRELEPELEHRCAGPLTRFELLVRACELVQRGHEPDAVAEALDNVLDRRGYFTHPEPPPEVPGS